MQNEKSNFPINFYIHFVSSQDMISKQTLDETIEAFQALPIEKRKIMLYVGVHPNECTHILSRPHEKEWERYGVAIVQHPRDSTPQAIWMKHKETCIDGFKPLSKDIRVIEGEYHKHILGDDKAWIVMFHGTDLEWKDKLEIILPPVMIWRDLNEVYGMIKDQYCDVDSGWYIQPGQILVEYYYRGLIPIIVDPILNEAISRFKDFHDHSFLKNLRNVQPTCYSQSDNLEGKAAIGPDYLDQNIVSPEERTLFHNIFSGRLTSLFHTLSRFDLKNYI